MNPEFKQLMAAFLLGVMVPSLVLNLSLKWKEPPGLSVQTQTGSTAPGELETKQIYVQLLDGSVVTMELETYIVGVVLGEMPADFEMEALKAQAVVARTYTLKRQEEGVRHPQGAVCINSGCCQAYISQESYLSGGVTQSNLEKIRTAVDQTAGQILTYGGALIEATYFSCSGGRTEDAVAVWGSDVPYLQAVDSPGEENASKFTATVSFTRQELASRLGVELNSRPESWFGTVTYTEGGGVAAMTVGGRRFTGVDLRKLLGLNSTAFSVSADADGITVSTFGHGHRVGMSQYGADAMAIAGNTYEQILLHYYQGTRIDKMDALGQNVGNTSWKV